MRGHEPYPAHALDRHGNLLLANSAVDVSLDAERCRAPTRPHRARDAQRPGLPHG
ncbi:hypothetical protein H4N64_24535 [Streptomyces sp. PSKA01]|uniref:Uncharacterized protein n=1 Tax=Streptomyces cupreus TaxID=2759956 RepID=A0A7X1J5Q3_9ACTN|nr:hypothetical protein [Streptomyces cupreus]